MKKLLLILLVFNAFCARQTDRKETVKPESVKEKTGAVCLRISLPLKNTSRFHDPQELYIFAESGEAGALIKSSYRFDDRFYFTELLPGRYHVAALEFQITRDKEKQKGYYLLTRRSSVQSLFMVTAEKLNYPGVLSGIFLRYNAANSDEQADGFLENLIPDSNTRAFYTPEKGKDPGIYMILSNAILFYPFNDDTVSVLKDNLYKLPNGHF